MHNSEVPTDCPLEFSRNSLACKGGRGKGKPFSFQILIAMKRNLSRKPSDPGHRKR